MTDLKQLVGVLTSLGKEDLNAVIGSVFRHRKYSYVEVGSIFRNYACGLYMEEFWIIREVNLNENCFTACVLQIKQIQGSLIRKIEVKVLSGVEELRRIDELEASNIREIQQALQDCPAYKHLKDFFVLTLENKEK